MGPSSDSIPHPKCPGLPYSCPLLFPGPSEEDNPGPGEPWLGLSAILLCSELSLWAHHPVNVTPSQSICTTYLQERHSRRQKTESSSLPAQPCLVICPLHCRENSGNAASVPDGTSKKSQLRGPTDSHLSSPTRHSGRVSRSCCFFFLPSQGDQYVVQKHLHPAKFSFTPTSIWTIPHSIPLIHQ